MEEVTTCSRAVEMRGLPLGSPRIRRRREAGAKTSTHRRHGRKMKDVKSARLSVIKDWKGRSPVNVIVYSLSYMLFPLQDIFILSVW